MSPFDLNVYESHTMGASQIHSELLSQSGYSVHSMEKELHNTAQSRYIQTRVCSQPVVFIKQILDFLRTKTITAKAMKTFSVVKTSEHCSGS